MTLTVHHLQLSQSERIVWLCEELNIPYRLVLHERDPETILAPKDLKSLHPAGTAPVIEDDPSPTTGGKIMLAESGGIVEYIIHVHGEGRLALTPKDKEYAEYVNWLHFANGTLQATVMRLTVVRRLNSDPDHPYAKFIYDKLNGALKMLDDRLKASGKYLAGQDVTAADIMTVFTLTTMRGFFPIDLTGYDNILAYLQRIGERDAYKRAMEKGDPGLKPLLGATVPLHKIVQK